MNNEIECVNDFLKNPKALTQMEADYKSKWSHHLTLLHVLLVKNNIKKNHIIMNQTNYKNIKKNHTKLSKKLGFSIHHKSLFQSRTLVPNTRFLNHDVIEELAKNSAISLPMIIYAKEEILSPNLNQLPSKGIGKLLEYPNCCINWLIESEVNDFEIGFAILNKRGDIDSKDTPEEIAIKIIQIHSDECQPDILYRLCKIWNHQLSKGRKKFPFCFHQSCDECLDNDKSPSALLNEKYANFAKENFPKLYEKIILESKIASNEYDEDVKHATSNLQNMNYDPDNSEILTRITPLDILD